MVDKVEEILANRSLFLKHLIADLKKNDEIIEAATESLNNLKSTATNVEQLGKKVAHTSLIPLGKNIHVNGTINHTGEYFLDKVAFPESYSVLETLDGTLKLLENKICMQSDLLKKTEESKQQIEERISLLQENEMPEEIISDKGVAVKVGEFYEIIEFEN